MELAYRGQWAGGRTLHLIHQTIPLSGFIVMDAQLWVRDPKNWHIGVYALVIGLVCSTASAQQPAEEPGQGVEIDSETDSANSTPHTAIEVPPTARPNGNGAGLLLSLDPDEYQAFLRWKAQKEAVPPSAPRFGITRVAIEGTADEETAHLSVEIRVRVRDSGRVAVPLRRLGALVDVEASDGWPVPVEDGYQWWVEGDGEHWLRLRWRVPVQTWAGSSRMEIPFPSPLPATVSSLRLTVPGASVTARTAERQELPVTPLPDGRHCQIELYGLPHPMIVEWQPQLPPSEEAPVQLSCEPAQWVVRIQRGLATTQATLPIQALQGRFDRLQIRLPQAAELLDVEAENLKSHRLAPPEDPQAGPLLMIEFQEPTQGPVTVHLAMQQPLPLHEPVYVIEGLQVERAVRQAGYVVVRVVGNLEAVPGALGSVHRLEAADLPPELRDGDLFFEFLRQPFRLPVQIQTRTPRVDVEPQMVLVLAKKGDKVEAHLHSRYTYSVQRVPVEEVQFDLRGWELGPGDVGPAPLVNRQKFTVEEPERAHIPLTPPTLGTFQFELHARRLLPVHEETLKLPLPVPKAATTTGARLTVVSDAAVEARLLSDRDSGWLSIRPPAAEDFPLPKLLPRYHQPPQYYWVRNLCSPLSVAVELRPQVVNVGCRTSVQVSSSLATVQQTFTYHVQHEPLSAIEMDVSQRLPALPILSDTGEFVSSTDSLLPLSSGPRPGTEEGIRHVRYVLPEPRLGEFQWSIRYEWPLTEPATDTVRQVKLPLMRPSDGHLVSNKLEVHSHPALSVMLGDSNTWQLISDTNSARTFHASQPVLALPLSIVQRSQPLLPAVVISRAWLRTTIHPQGEQSYRCWYRIASTPGPLTIELPPGSELLDVRVDGQPARLEIEPQGRLRLFLPTPGPVASTAKSSASMSSLARSDRTQSPDAVASPPEHLLMIEYQNAVARSESRWGNHVTLRAPRISKSRCSEGWFWQVLLPAGQYLLEASRELTAEHRWQRRGWLWSRVPTNGNAELAQWIGLTPFPLEVGHSAHGYLFSRIGAGQGFSEIQPVHLITLTPPSLVLIGAGAALLIGFTLTLVSAARSLIFVLILGSAVALAASWYPSAAMLLLPPAAIGTAFAALGGLIRWKLLRRQQRGNLVPPESSPVIRLSSKIVPRPSVSADSSHSTAHRRDSGALKSQL